MPTTWNRVARRRGRPTRAAADDARPLRVLMSFGTPKPTTNPYVKQLAAAVAAQPGVDLRFFDRWTAILGPSYDVFHVHWPEILLEARTPARRAYRRVSTAMLLARLWLTRTRVVRTWHNLERPTGLARTDYWLLDVFDRLTVLRIRLNDSGPMPDDAPFVTIPHGHYRDWYAPFPGARPCPAGWSSSGWCVATRASSSWSRPSAAPTTPG